MKKLLYGTLVLALVGIAFTFSSCEKNNIIEEQNQAEFRRTNISVDPTAHLMLSAYENPNNVQIRTVAKGGSITIADLWSKKSKCKKIGICKWFPKEVKPEMLFEISRRNLLSGRTIIINVKDMLTKERLNLYFQNSTKGVHYQDLSFVITDDVYINHSHKIKAGTYPINVRMGRYGGYKIPIHRTAL